jgi:hypothetical protein
VRLLRRNISLLTAVSDLCRAISVEYGFGIDVYFETAPNVKKLPDEFIVVRVVEYKEKGVTDLINSTDSNNSINSTDSIKTIGLKLKVCIDIFVRNLERDGDEMQPFIKRLGELTEAVAESVSGFSSGGGVCDELSVKMEQETSISYWKNVIEISGTGTEAEVYTGVLYAGGLAYLAPPLTEADIRGLATVIHNPQKGQVFVFTANAGTVTVCIAVPAVMAPERIRNLGWGYDMTEQFALYEMQVDVDGIACDVYYYRSTVPFEGAMSLEVSL